MAIDRVTEAVADLKLARQYVVGVFVATRRNLRSWKETAELGVALGLDATISACATSRVGAEMQRSCRQISGQRRL